MTQQQLVTTLIDRDKAETDTACRCENTVHCYSNIQRTRCYYSIRVHNQHESITTIITTSKLIHLVAMNVQYMHSTIHIYCISATHTHTHSHMHSTHTTQTHTYKHSTTHTQCHAYMYTHMHERRKTLNSRTPKHQIASILNH